MNLKLSIRVFYFTLLCISKSTIFAASIGGVFLKHPETGQKVTIIGDIHTKIPQSLAIEQYLSNKIESLANNNDIRIYFEGNIVAGQGLDDLKNALLGVEYSTLRRMWQLAEEKKDVYINVENREFMLPLLNISILSLAGLFELDPIEMNIFKSFCASEGSIKYAYGPLRHFIDLLKIALNNVIKETKENFPGNDLVNNYLDRLKVLVLFTSMGISLKLAKYLDTESWELIDSEFRNLYFNYSGGLSLDILIVNMTSFILDLNFINRIFKDKKDCILFTGYQHILGISDFLKNVGFESELKYDLKTIEGKEYTSLIDFCTNEIKDEPESPASFSEAIKRSATGHPAFTKICPISKEAIDEIFAQYE